MPPTQFQIDITYERPSPTMLLATLYAYALQNYFGKYHVMGAIRMTTSMGCTNDNGEHAMLNYYTMWVPN